MQKYFPALPKSESVVKAMLHIEQNYAHIREVCEIAAAAGVGYPCLRAKFPRETGFTLREYLTNIRLEQAQVLLRSTDLSGKQISWRVGHRNESHFCRLFREHFGMTMMEYREQYAEAV